LSFGIDGLNLFQGVKNGVTQQIQDKYVPPLRGHSLHGTSHQSSDVNFVSNPCCELHRRFVSIIIIIHNPKRHLEFLILMHVDLMKVKGSKIL
jgi:hypothetical protein